MIYVIKYLYLESIRNSHNLMKNIVKISQELECTLYRRWTDVNNHEMSSLIFRKSKRGNETHENSYLEKADQ